MFKTMDQSTGQLKGIMWLKEMFTTLTIGFSMFYLVHILLEITIITEIMHIFLGVGNLYERCHIGFLRRWAANECLEQIKADDLFTNCISIGPVNCSYYP